MAWATVVFALPDPSVPEMMVMVLPETTMDDAWLFPLALLIATVTEL